MKTKTILFLLVSTVIVIAYTSCKKDAPPRPLRRCVLPKVLTPELLPIKITKVPRLPVFYLLTGGGEDNALLWVNV